ncbi:RDD family protein [Leeuwenhoekiella aequorea]|uniref:Putative RDD family membrane protein YckC n=1 Tax=Leeuwenhoekiella aequorea TaxID=283736 RepID=A0A4Q0PAJ2_9FLAO|nr:RDD family protein [Leeuwenhoekiella aequorea]RXG23306.1 putative RDD family membrane protein YckC [Leeuwenhoekiella aequorea]|tara:strand:- start:8 stop:730 length:723 start_codon:yes stop_codon:yes gene_type:complete
MDNFQIETAQNVSINQNVAGIGDRILAYIIDFFILVAYFLITVFSLAAFGIESNSLASASIFFMVIGIPAFLYFLFMETFWNGRTLGKAALNLRVVKIDGSKPGFGSFFVRWIMRTIDISLTSGGIAVFTILLNGKGQRLGDIAAGTTVISERKKVNLRQTLLEEIPEDYVPKYPQVTVFNDADIQKVKTIYSQSRYNGKHNVIVKLSDKLARTMQITPDEKPIQFIDRVLKDYNYYTQL